MGDGSLRTSKARSAVRGHWPPAGGTSPPIPKPALRRSSSEKSQRAPVEPRSSRWRNSRFDGACPFRLSTEQKWHRDPNSGPCPSVPGIQPTVQGLEGRNVLGLTERIPSGLNRCELHIQPVGPFMFPIFEFEPSQKIRSRSNKRRTGKLGLGGVLRRIVDGSPLNPDGVHDLSLEGIFGGLRVFSR